MQEYEGIATNIHVTESGVKWRVKFHPQNVVMVTTRLPSRKREIIDVILVTVHHVDRSVTKQDRIVLIYVWLHAIPQLLSKLKVKGIYAMGTTKTTVGKEIVTVS
ncbi:hypothetical protein NQ318_005057 [Aromia moschata]|uniref:Uncharacterized protein n=1 Tax=Aromia moschata TaxID=1265417 RepID=A0AAV8YE62_9CUCU|nr:hypothetical protein NQ318_005057 [Aromia moschata]